MTRELKVTRFDGLNGYFALAIKRLSNENSTDFYIGKEGLSFLEFCFGVPDQPKRRTDAEYAETCFDKFTKMLDERIEERRKESPWNYCTIQTRER